MRADPQLPRLYVEGQNDCRVICALLDALGTALNKDSGPVIIELMPSPAAHSGTLEDFLRGMIPASDAILPKANAYVNDIVSSVSPCARFRDVDRAKAEMYSWLAVQKNPGESYALAIKSRLLLADAPMAREFHAWFCRLYDL